jgi:hypothetical protein
MRINEVLSGLVELDQIFRTNDASVVETLEEGKWIKGKLDRNIRIDQPTHGAGQVHGHVLGRKGKQLGIVNLDGTASHGTKMALSIKDAEALRAAGFNIRNDRVVEWISLCDSPNLLFE